MDKITKDYNQITMVDRAFKIIDYIFNSEIPLGVSEISKSLDLPKATIFRLLNTLTLWGILEKNNDDKYYLGKTLIKYGNKAMEDLDIVNVAAPIVKDLCSEIGETVNIGVEHEKSMVTVLCEQGESTSLVSKLMPVCPLYCSSMGKIILSYYNEKDLEAYFSSNTLEKRTINSITTLEEFCISKKSILESNISYDKEEYEYGLTCIGSPVFDINNNLVACISVSGPTTRLQYKGFDKIEEKLLEAANKITKSIHIIS